MKTPQTDTAAYNGHEYLLNQCKEFELENQVLMSAIRYISEMDNPRAGYEIHNASEVARNTISTINNGQ